MEIPRPTNGKQVEYCSSESHVQKILYLSNSKSTQAKGVGSMAMWDSVPVKNFIVSVLHLQVGLGNYFKNNPIDFIESDVDKLLTVEEV